MQKHCTEPRFICTVKLNKGSIMEIKRVSIHEKMANSRALDCFIFSLVHPNIDGVKNVLGYDGSFSGVNKVMFLGKMNLFFSELSNVHIEDVVVNRGVCMDTLPGADVIEIRYAKSRSFFDEHGRNPNDLGEPRDGDEIVLRFAVSLCDGRINNISSTKLFKASEMCQTDNLMLNLN